MTAAVLLALAVAQQVPQVRITSPPPGKPVLGVLVVSAVVSSDEPLREVSFVLDGRQVATVTRPPFEAEVNFGLDSVAHRLVVVARTASGVTSEATLEIPSAGVSQEMRLELQQLYVVATSEGRRVRDLEQRDFRVFDSGQPQEIVTFARGEIPFSAVLLLDASLSMFGAKLQAALDGARAFVTSMRPLDEAKLMVFSDRPVHTTPFTNVPEILVAGLEHVSADGGTTLNDTLFLGLRLLEERQGRRVAVVLSDGADSHSVLSLQEVLPRLQERRALLYWIRLLGESGEAAGASGTLFSAWRAGPWYRDQARLLEGATAESGGRVVTVRSASEIAPAFAEVVRELREQYVLGYYPSTLRGDGSWHRVEVSVDRRGIKVATISGYREP